MQEAQSECSSSSTDCWSKEPCSSCFTLAEHWWEVFWRCNSCRSPSRSQRSSQSSIGSLPLAFWVSIYGMWTTKHQGANMFDCIFLLIVDSSFESIINILILIILIDILSFLSPAWASWLLTSHRHIILHVESCWVTVIEFSVGSVGLHHIEWVEGWLESSNPPWSIVHDSLIHCNIVLKPLLCI